MYNSYDLMHERKQTDEIQYARTVRILVYLSKLCSVHRALARLSTVGGGQRGAIENMFKFCENIRKFFN